MAKYASGRFAKRISDRSGLAFPYNEMVKEWNGSTVHYTEFEPKHPQLDPKYHPTDPQSLENPKRQTIDAIVELGINLVGKNLFNVKKQTISQFNPIPAPGAFETVIVNTMQPETENKNITMKSFVGNPTVVIS
jgi:hypothetical protein|tara:strand:+ start:42 stop:443 length:402 start_codon:yes stop_codon:yes gene_type:complete